MPVFFRPRPRSIGEIKYGGDSSFSKYKYLLPNKVFDSRGRVIKIGLGDGTPRSHIRALKNYLYSVEMLNDVIFRRAAETGNDGKD
jgi:hypothetical protein